MRIDRHSVLATSGLPLGAIRRDRGEILAPRSVFKAVGGVGVGVLGLAWRT